MFNKLKLIRPYHYAILLLLIALVLLVIISLKPAYNFLTGKWIIDISLSNNYGMLVGGLIGVFTSAATALFLYETFTQQRKQNFEDNLFQLVSAFNESKTYNPDPNPNEGGHTSFAELFHSFEQTFINRNDSTFGQIEQDKLTEEKKNRDVKLMKKFIPYIENYVNRLAFIFQFIKGHHTNNRERYFKLVLYQLSIFELIYLKKLTHRMINYKWSDNYEKYQRAVNNRTKLYNTLYDNELIPTELQQGQELRNDLIEIFKKIKVENPEY
jgi:NADH:ubiquinone oxidoreductase subunit 5 (subunit L)/multisubunit Na+/H+ antiporter MnhA subunit